MSILDAFRREARMSVESPLLPLTSSTLLDWTSGPQSVAGVSVNEQKSLGMSAVWRAVNLISGTVASLPLHAFTEDDNGIQKRVPSTQSAPQFLAKPHPDLLPMEFWELTLAHLGLWGNAYCQKLYDQSGRLKELWPIHPSMVKPGRARDMTKVYLINGDEANPKTDREIVHFRGFGLDTTVGLSPIQCARQGIGLSLAAEEYGARLFGSGSLASGILTTDRTLTQDQATALKDRWASKAQGLQKAHEAVVLDSGAKFQQLSIPPEDAQFIESRRFQVAEIARIYGVPPHMLMETDRSTSWGTGIEQQGIGFVVYTLRPWLTRIEQRVSSILSPAATYARYSVEGLLRGDSSERAAFYTQMWNIGVYSTNDIRRLENQPPVEGGDVRYRPLNMGELGVADPEPTTEPVTEPTTEEVPA